MAGSPRDILVLPTSDVYVLDYDSQFDGSARLVEKPVIAVGTYHSPSNTLRVESLTPYSQLDLPKPKRCQLDHELSGIQSGNSSRSSDS